MLPVGFTLFLSLLKWNVALLGQVCMAYHSLMSHCIGMLIAFQVFFFHLCSKVPKQAKTRGSEEQRAQTSKKKMRFEDSQLNTIPNSGWVAWQDRASFFVVRLSAAECAWLHLRGTLPQFPTYLLRKCRMVPFQTPKEPRPQLMLRRNLQRKWKYELLKTAKSFVKLSSLNEF